MHYRASQHYQENVFIEASRPQYLEDLHSEAQEGLKIQQQQGQNLSETLRNRTLVENVFIFYAAFYSNREQKWSQHC